MDGSVEGELDREPLTVGDADGDSLWVPEGVAEPVIDTDSEKPMLVVAEALVERVGSPESDAEEVIETESIVVFIVDVSEVAEADPPDAVTTDESVVVRETDEVALRSHDSLAVNECEPTLKGTVGVREAVSDGEILSVPLGLTSREEVAETLVVMAREMLVDGNRSESDGVRERLNVTDALAESSCVMDAVPVGVRLPVTDNVLVVLYITELVFVALPWAVTVSLAVLL